MKKPTLLSIVVAVIVFAVILFPPQLASQLQRNTTMSCIFCHADPAAGGFHGGFRSLINLAQADVEVICATCHDGVSATEAVDHTNPGKEFGAWKAGCLDCHNHHYDLLAGDSSGNRNLNLLGAIVREASSTDGIARIRKPIIIDVNGDNGGTSNKRFEEDVQAGWECKSGVADDPSCIDHGETTPKTADHVRKLIFYLNTTSTGEHWAAANTDLDPPWNGSCNVCHTRAGNHRRDGTADQTHNIERNCTQCHNHKDAWVNKGG